MKNNSIFNYFLIIFGLCTCAENNAEIGACIRFKMDDTDFKEVVIVDKCFCIQV